MADAQDLINQLNELNNNLSKPEDDPAENADEMRRRIKETERSVRRSVEDVLGVDDDD